MELYQGQINEFIDWITGIDSRTNSNITGNLPVSGYSIRLLLLSHLVKPFVKYDDVSGGLYLFFSSEEAKNEWLRLTGINATEEDREKAVSIPIASMARPSDTTIDVKSISYDGSEGDIGNSRYVISGDSKSDAALINYIVRMFKELAGQSLSTVDGFTVTFYIKNAAGAETRVVERYDSDKVTTSEHIILSFPCYSYLREGTNIINITVNANNSAATFSSNISVYLVKFKLESSFDFSKAVQLDRILSVPITITKSILGMTMNIYAQIASGNEINKTFTNVVTSTTNSLDNPYTTTLEILNLYPYNQNNEDHIVHTLKLFATLGSGGSATLFTSNIIYYTFETASPVSGIINKFVNIKYDVAANKDYVTPDGNIVLYAMQYEPFTLNWSYYTDHLNIDSSINVLWYLKYKKNGSYTESLVGSGIGSKSEISKPFTFIPEVFLSLEDGAELIARLTKSGEEITIQSFPIIIEKSNYDIQEASDVVLKLQAYGRSNASENKNTWTDLISGNNVVTFANVAFDDRSGWVDNSLQLLGVGTTAIIDYNPFPANYSLSGNGKTIEIDFTPVKSHSDNDILISIGNSLAGHIDIKPTEASLYIRENLVVHTNYKVGERIKLAFIFNRYLGSNNPENNLVYIINNGILDRAADMGTSTNYLSADGNITIGGTESICRIYNIRVYDKPLTYKLELNNFIFDSSDKSAIISRNQLFENELLKYELCCNKIDTILIEGLPDNYGGLTKILDSDTAKKDSETTVNITRTCISDDTKQFRVSKAMIRKHGLSTINYPITSLKFWTNKSATAGDTPIFEELSDYQRALNLNKNRYIMKDGAIPANKFVLQANYADSSGVHNGTLLRLINDIWYNANFGTNESPIYRLRTAPLLFSSGHKVIHNNSSLGEDGWIEGVYNENSESSNYKSEYVNKTWPEITNKQFPYKIRVGADSFPCAVFYNDPLGDGNPHFLGLYVFMDDKKSDYIYGERSIYAFGDCTDPFVMNINNTKNGINGKQDIAANRVWNNKNVLRIEIVLPNTLVTSYMSMNVPTSIKLDDEGNITESAENFTLCTNIKYDLQGNPIKYYWEDYFEMIYPDPDDIEKDDNGNITKFNPNSKFVTTAQPFIDFLEWITGIAALNVDGNNEPHIDGTVNQTALNRFIAEAALHLDLYKLAAYYIFYLRFGLVDSVERNAQLKTYDGIHWHYEPWDIDIALGDTNQGALILNPPLTRDSVIPLTSTKAFSGRGASTSNFMWDCLEAWDYWINTLVPKVSEILYNAGLTYDNVSTLFDEEYSNKWAESLYNEAELFKYIKNGGSEYLPWLQGARTSHRHWWLSTSMNYYDAKWACGTFKNKRVVLFVEKGAHQSGDILTIKPTSSTYFELTLSGGDSSIDRKAATPAVPAQFDISSTTFSAKDPTWIYGGLFIEELDLSCFASSMSAVDVSRCYDSTLGANIKVLNIGVPLTDVDDTLKSGLVSGTALRITAVNALEETDALSELITLDITGLSTIKNTQGLFVNNDRKNIRNFYASGTSLSEFTNAPSGNIFDNLVLPGTTIVINSNDSLQVSNIISISMHNASWNNLEFWNTTASNAQIQALDENRQPIYVQEEVDGLLVNVLDENDQPIPVYNPAGATYDKLSSIPTTITNVIFDGSTCRNECSLLFLLDWINSIKSSIESDYPGYTPAKLREELHNVLKNKRFIAENINWNSQFSTMLTYDLLEDIAYLNGVTISGDFNNNRYKYIKGYVVLGLNLTASLMINIKKWFGDSAFDKSAVNSLLVVDSTENDVIINVDGVSVDMLLKETNTASMSVTKFTLGDSAGTNEIIGEVVNPEDEEYIWSLAESLNASMWSSSYKSCHLEKNTYDGRILLVTEEGTDNNYSVVVRVSYKDENDLITHSFVTINIIGVVYPTGYSLDISGQDLRRFYCNNSIASNLHISTQYPTYVLYKLNLTINLNLNPLGEFDATIKDVLYRITELHPNNSSINWTTANDNDNIISNFTNIEYSSVSDGDTLNIKLNLLPSGTESYLVSTRMKVGGENYYHEESIYILLIDDNEIIVGQNQNSGLYLSLILKYNTLYSLTNNYPNLYKTHLLSIYGELSFTSNKSLVTTLLTDESTPQSVLLHLPYITSLSLLECNQFSNTLLSAQFDISNCSNLTTINLKDSNLTGTINVPTQILSLNTQGTGINVNVPQNSLLTTLSLGSPTSVVINSPTVLDSSGVSILSISNLTTLTLTGVNLNEPCGFTLFNTLYNPV